MEVSNKIKEEIRKTQSDLKNAIRVHQIWVARLQEDESNVHLKSKVKEAERDIMAIGQTQKLVVERLRRELELYQQRLKVRNKQVNLENDNRYVAQQLRDHQLHYRSRTRSVSLLKPSVLNEIHIKSENNHEEAKGNLSDSDNELKSNEKVYSNHSDGEDMEKYARSYTQMPNTVHGSRNNFTNALNKVKESLIGTKLQHNNEHDNENDDEQMDWQEQRSDSDYSGVQHSPTPSPTLLPEPGEPITQETFLRLVDLVTHAQKEVLEKKRSERRKRSTTSTNRTDFLYGNFDMMPAKRKKFQFPYLQSHHDPPQTRSAKLRKQQHQTRSSREGSPSGSSSENKGWSNGKPAWAASLPASLSVEPVYTPAKKVCHGCGRSDVPSLLVWCAVCGVCVHTGCGIDGRCSNCRAHLPDPTACAAPVQSETQMYKGLLLQRSDGRAYLPDPTGGTKRTHADKQFYRDKLAERKRLQEKNIELCVELRKLEARAASLKENLDEHNAEKRHLLAAQIRTQRNLQKLLDFISQFKETSISLRSTSLSETASEISKSNEE